MSNPVLLADWALEEFEDWAAHCPSETALAAKRAFQTLTKFGEKMVADPRTYPLVAGPLESIIRRLQAGEITESRAFELASSAEICRNVSPVYVAAISMRNQGRANDGGWKEALLAQKVLLAALDARQKTGERGQQVLEMLAVIDYVVIVTRAVWEYADGRLFSNAVWRANALTEVETRPWHEPGEIEFALGTLHQDPYVYERPIQNFDLVIGAWRRRPLEQLGPILGELEAEALFVPTPLDAFTASSKYFLQSANKRTGPDRGLSLKGYMAAEVWKQIAGGQAADLSEIATEAKGLLGEDRFLGVRAEIDSLMDFGQSDSKKTAGKSGTDWMAEAQRILATSTEDLVKKRGVVQATDMMQNVAFAVAPLSRDLSFGLWRKALHLVVKRDENTRKGFYYVGLGSIRGALAHPEVETFIAVTSPLQGAAECRQRAAKEAWPPMQLGATLLSISVNSQTGDRELEGVQVVESIAEADSEFANEFRPLLVWHSAVLYGGIASNMFYANRYSDAIRNYATAAREFLATKMPVEAERMLALGADIVQRSEDQLPTFAEYFRLVIPELERQGEPTVVRRVQNLCREWMPLLVNSDDLDLKVAMKLLDATKGPAFASEMRAGGDLAWVQSEESRALLARIEHLQNAQNVEGAGNEDLGPIDDEILVTMYAGDEEMQSSDTNAAVLHNLQIRYDAELRRQLSGRAPREQAWDSAPEKIASVLGPETVQLVYYSGLARNGNAALYICVFTNDSAEGKVIDLGVPGAPNLVSGLLDTVAVNVARARRGVNTDPEAGVISREGQEALAECAIYVSGPVGEMLQALRKGGKRHLCIQPHGPLHFFPFHLLPSGTSVMAEDWTITYLPNLAMLDPALRTAQVRKVPIASFGIEFENENPHGLPKLPGAEQEACIVASAYGANGVTGGSATEAALTAALAKARRIHVATHGLLKVSAPSFQRIYVWPEGDSDGIVHAYELLRSDLRGLDLLTLSACETSLGRIDISDNSWGLSANALIAGAATVIGTLWPVENSAAKSFFGFLHQKLAGGTEKREAFRMAQDWTRSRHPQFRDWGAFCYSGRW
ncbi:MAG: CHAT domain-containing protein [Candidatus Sulfotelmatobacter sp.]